MRPWPKTLYETDASGAPVSCTCYYYVGMKKKQVREALQVPPLLSHNYRPCDVSPVLLAKFFSCRIWSRLAATQVRELANNTSHGDAMCLSMSSAISPAPPYVAGASIQRVAAPTGSLCSRFLMHTTRPCIAGAGVQRVAAPAAGQGEPEPAGGPVQGHGALLAAAAPRHGGGGQGHEPKRAAALRLPRRYAGLVSNSQCIPYLAERHVCSGRQVVQVLLQCELTMSHCFEAALHAGAC